MSEPEVVDVFAGRRRLPSSVDPVGFGRLHAAVAEALIEHAAEAGKKPYRFSERYDMAVRVLAQAESRDRRNAMSDADPSRIWEAADDLDRVLYEVWCAAMDARLSKDMLEDLHYCSECGAEHGRSDEAKYVEMQRALLTNARRKLDALLAGGTP